MTSLTHEIRNVEILISITSSNSPLKFCEYLLLILTNSILIEKKTIVVYRIDFSTAQARTSY